MAAFQKNDAKNCSYKCVVKSCKNSNKLSSKEFPVELYSFPSHRTLFNKWIRILHLDGNVNNNDLRICGRHFEAKYLGKLKLESDAVPTLNLSEKTSLSSLNDVSCTANESNNEPTVGDKTFAKPTTDVPLDEFCYNCFKKQENAGYYRNQWFETLALLKKQNEALNICRKQLRVTKQTNLKAKKHYMMEKSSLKNLLCKISSISYASPNAKTICKMLLKTSSTSYTAEEAVVALNIDFYSSKAYDYLRDELDLNLPSRNALLLFKQNKLSE